MITDRPSLTMRSAAAARAAHLHLFATNHIHVDNFALRLLGMRDAAPLREMRFRWRSQSPARVCAYFALRQRYSEDRLQQAIDRGVRQVVLLGAGLDSLALRRPELAHQITFAEVDHPESQRWKRGRLDALGLETPGVLYVPVDFGREDLEQRLVESGIALDQPTFFSWLGVTQYIDRTAVDATLGYIARHPRGSEVVFTFIVERPGERVQRAGDNEAWITFFEPSELEKHLAAIGFTAVERLTPELAAARYYAGQPADVTPLEYWQVISAGV